MNKAGFEVNGWARSVGIGRTKTYDLIKKGLVQIVKIGSRTIITTSPEEFLEKMEGHQ